MKWPVLYADPPWDYQNWTKAKNGAAESAMKTVTTTEMMKWDVGSLAEDNSLLFLWATWPKLQDALQVIEAWGFKYITCPFVWNKTYASGTPYCGLGFWTRSGTEFVLMGKKGKGVPRAKDATNVRQVVDSIVRRPHSTKPDEIAYRINKLVGRDVHKLELFARDHGNLLYQNSEYWTGTGLEFDGSTIENFIKINKAMEEK